MPIYEYVCRSCGHELEQLQRLSDDPLTECPECAEPQLKRKISAAGFRLSGGGWYETDFKSDGKRNLAGDEKASKSDSAPAAKSGGDTGQGAKSATAKPKTETKADSASKPAKKPADKPAAKPASQTSD